ncbi:hypothetical protein H072_920 [Dactylellina haptotyla CBS 200.50]|uniref:Uncharacterized protein n=1 Tax=Dactylellina haptotyla (strain CBS 200.50) TaxID=1284197 RepID=S8AW02_DACHA|nr:hypothetical protein H072_920 [Dactylellina haptotyla CBS 200.50]
MKLQYFITLFLLGAASATSMSHYACNSTEASPELDTPVESSAMLYPRATGSAASPAAAVASAEASSSGSATGNSPSEDEILKEIVTNQLSQTELDPKTLAFLQKTSPAVYEKIAALDGDALDKAVEDLMKGQVPAGM